MLKSKLENGMKVVMKNNKAYFVHDNNLIGLKGGCFSLDRYTENLGHLDVMDFDITKVFKHDGKIWVECVSEIKQHYSHVINYDVMFDGPKTTVILESGTQASTTCLPEDKYNRSKGIAIAYTKAAIKGYIKNLKVLAK